MKTFAAALIAATMLTAPAMAQNDITISCSGDRACIAGQSAPVYPVIRRSTCYVVAKDDSLFQIDCAAKAAIPAPVYNSGTVNLGTR